nr:inovirus-type Gp2 protein [Vibrio cholerae]
MHDTIDLALGEYPRLMAIRVDLRFPKLRNNEKSGNVMTVVVR